MDDTHPGRHGDLPEEATTPEELESVLRAYAGTDGFHERIDDRHYVSFVRRGPSLLVSFESVRQSLARPGGLPLGLDFVEDKNWSLLHFTANGDTWFRSPAMMEFLDGLTEEDDLLAFERAVVYGAGMGGYAACAYSVIVPGAMVLAVRPQATLDPALAPWETRFRAARRLDFTNRYGYAPEMLEGAMRAFVLFDPREATDAMQATLFRAPNVTLLRCPFAGPETEATLQSMDILHALIEHAGEGRLDRAAFARLYRNRRRSGEYLRNLLLALDGRDKPLMTARLCRYVLGRQRAPAFRKRLRLANEALVARGLAPIDADG